MKHALIVDDHPVARLAVKMLLKEEGISVSGEADDGAKALVLARQLAPDLIIIDIDIPSINGITVVQRLRNNDFKGGILVLTSKEESHYVHRCISAGADGFVGKRNNLDELHDAIRAVRGGYSFFPLKRHQYMGGMEAGESSLSALARLSDKELHTLRLLGKGMKVVDIAHSMSISDRTVSTYKRRLMIKLGVNNMAELFQFIQQNNLD